MLIHEVVLQFDHILYQIVSILVFNHEVESADDDLREGDFLGKETLLKTSLEYTASVFVAADLVTLDHTGIEDEVGVDGILLGTSDIHVAWLL